MNPYEVGRPKLTEAQLSEDEAEGEQPYEPRLLRLFLTNAGRITVYGILGLLLLLVASLYWPD